jgi:predicted HTH domain antitoxin
MVKKTISMRINDEDYRFLSVLAKKEREDVSKKVRELVNLGRVMLAIEKYKKSEASIERAARIAGVSVSNMMDILHPPTQDTTALAVEECVSLEATIAAMNQLCFGGFRTVADDPPKPRRRWVGFLGTTGLPVGLHEHNVEMNLQHEDYLRGLDSLRKIW